MNAVSVTAFAAAVWIRYRVTDPRMRKCAKYGEIGVVVNVTRSTTEPGTYHHDHEWTLCIEVPPPCLLR